MKITRSTVANAAAKTPRVIHEQAKDNYSFMIFLSYLKRAPKIVQEIYYPYIARVADHYATSANISSIIDRMKVRVRGIGKLTPQHSKLFHNYRKIFDLDETVLKMLTSQNAFPRPVNLEKYYLESPMINLIRPKYYLTEKVAKQQGEIDLGTRVQSIEDNKSSFYTEPRFIERLNELVHYQNNKKLKDSILLLEYNGHGIKGGRSYAVISRNCLQIWQMSSQVFPFPFAQNINSQIEAEAYLNSEKMKIKQKEIQTPKFRMNHRFYPHPDKVTCCSFSSDEYYIITGSTDRKVKLWCLRLMTQLAEYNCHSKVVWDVQFNPSGYHFLSGSADGLMILWTTDHDNPMRILDHGSDIYKVGFARLPDFAISVGEDSRIKIWHLIDASLRHCIQLANPIVNFNLGHSGIYLLAIQADGRVTIYNMLEGVVVSSFYYLVKKVRKEKESIALIHDACFSEDEREITCITTQYILLYSMEVIESQKKVNVFDQSKGAGPMRRIMPKQVIMVTNKVKLNFCGYRDFRVLVVGGSIQ